MQITEAFKGKTLVITGGTGSFGSTVLIHFLTTNIGEICDAEDPVTVIWASEILG